MNTPHNNDWDIDILLTEYSTGTLDDALSLVAAAYITLSPDARRHVAAVERLGGAMVDRCCEPVAMAPRSLENVLDKLEECRAAKQSAAYNTSHAPVPLLDSLPHAVKACLVHRCAKIRPGERIPWNRRASGLKICDLPTASIQYTPRLVRMAPGTRIPAHTHRGLECMLVLEGGFSDERGHYEVGDLILLPAGTTHHPVAHETEGCLCLAATEAPVRPVDLLPRLMNMLLRF